MDAILTPSLAHLVTVFPEIAKIYVISDLNACGAIRKQLPHLILQGRFSVTSMGCHSTVFAKISLAFFTPNTKLSTGICIFGNASSQTPVSSPYLVSIKNQQHRSPNSLHKLWLASVIDGRFYTCRIILRGITSFPS